MFVVVGVPVLVGGGTGVPGFANNGVAVIAGGRCVPAPVVGGGVPLFVVGAGVPLFVVGAGVPLFVVGAGVPVV